jgi:hypothetical protein
MIILRPVLLSIGVGAGRDYELMPRVTDVLKDKIKMCGILSELFFRQSFRIIPRLTV